MSRALLRASLELHAAPFRMLVRLDTAAIRGPRPEAYFGERGLAGYEVESSCVQHYSTSGADGDWRDFFRRFASSMETRP